ncbi:MAG: PQQ-binding-like beta-propeller repeat protein, partial [Planctomycetes bacterium]|nr:PQQ-binding-like beta-propeller repeat protein [Planctomycetota bacterium]
TSAGLYGRRIAAHVASPSSFPLPPYLANLTFCEDLKSAGIDATDRIIDSLFRPLRPYGGVVCLPLSDAQHAQFAKAKADSTAADAELSRDDNLTILKRSGPLPRSGIWSHQYTDASNSVVSKDELVKAPLGLLWFGGPANDKVLPRHGHGPSPQVAGGRLVIEGADMLRCVDVYTGRVLWEKDLPGLGTYYNKTSHFAGAGEIGSNYVTLADAVYAVYGSKILKLNAATGETEHEFMLELDGDNQAPSWGFLAVWEDLLIATSSPVTVSAAAGKVSASVLPKDMRPIIKPAAKWSYLAGSDPPGNWTKGDFNLNNKWRTGTAGFGYGDGDDRTVLNDMKGRYGRGYVRTSFEGKDVIAASQLVLAVRFDDAFIAYLNGKEIVRAGVRSGNGAKASGIGSHEADGYEIFDITNFRQLLLPGENVLALEGHNTGLTSSDFTLDPCLLAKMDKKSPPRKDQPAKEKPRRVADALNPTQYSSASRRLVVMNRKTGEVLWSRTAEFNFRHNCIAVAAGKVFCIDSMTDAKRQALARRGIEPSAKPRLLALDARTGKETWSTDKDVFGTFLSYSVEHDVLLQAGSAYRDRARDEVGRGMIAYRGKDGKVLWQDTSRSHGGPCLLWKDKIITNGGGGSMFKLLTGDPVDWKYSRMYGCNTAVGSQNLLTFRSGAAGFCDLAGDSGTGNLGGFRSSCTANLIAADGVLNAPDYTRTCSCAYQNQCSLALIHMPEAEMWTFSSRSSVPDQFGINFGAPGDRRDANGTLWYDFPTIGGKSPKLPVKIGGDDLRYFRRHVSTVQAGEGDLPWVGSSSIVGISSFEQSLPDTDKGAASRYTVRLHFSEPEYRKPGERVFDVHVNGKPQILNLDVAKEAGSTTRTLVKQLMDISASGKILITFVPRKGSPCISGVEIRKQK